MISLPQVRVLFAVKYNKRGSTGRLVSLHLFLYYFLHRKYEWSEYQNAGRDARRLDRVNFAPQTN